MKHLIAITFLMLLSGSVVYGQAPASNLTAPPKKDYKYDGKIVTTYDTGKAQTIVLIQLMDIKEAEVAEFVNVYSPTGQTYDYLAITWFFAYPGKTFATPKSVSVGFAYEAQHPERYESRKLTAKIDGEKVELGKMDEMGERKLVTRHAKPNYVRGLLEMTIPYELFLRLANAKKVKMKLGEFEFDLSKDHLNAMRDLASRTVP
jgi:hypothetical protein